jgi:hypothetical protein
MQGHEGLRWAAAIAVMGESACHVHELAAGHNKAR